MGKIYVNYKTYITSGDGDFSIDLITDNEEKAKELFIESRKKDQVGHFFAQKAYIAECEMNKPLNLGIVPSNYMMSLVAELDGISKDNVIIMETMNYNNMFSSTDELKTLKNYFKENEEISELFNIDEELFKKVNTILNILNEKSVIKKEEQEQGEEL